MKMPFLTLRRHIELNVYTQHGGIHDKGFLDKPSQSPHMKKPKIFDSWKTGYFPVMQVSISTCFGLIEIQRRSMALKSWMDWEMSLTSGGVSHNEMNQGLIHLDMSHTGQTNGFADRHGVEVVKVCPPFSVECREDVDFIMSQSPFSPQCLSYIGGVTNFKFQHAINFFIYLARDRPGKWQFNSGDDLVNFTPLSDRPLKIMHHYDKEYYEYLQHKTLPLTKHNSFQKRRKAHNVKEGKL